MLPEEYRDQLAVHGTDSLMPMPAVDETVVQEQNLAYDNIFNFQKAYIRLKKIRDDWSNEKSKTQKDRKYREIDLDPKDLRTDGSIAKDETLITMRTIDTNIRREKPSLISYIKNSRRLVTFKSLDDKNYDTQIIEREFTDGMTYEDWEEDWNKEIDAHQAHGWAAIEVVFDETKPLHVGLEYIPHDELMFPIKTRRLENSPILIREYSITKEKLREFVAEFGFSKDQVDILTKPKDENSSNQDDPICIYKKYCKYEGEVYVAWFTLEQGVTDWLKAPTKHYVGIREQVTTVTTQMTQMPMTDAMGNVMGYQMQPVQVPQTEWVDKKLTQYPIFLLKYSDTEKPEVMELKGRCFYDKPIQEGLTAGWSGLINGLTRSTNVYGSPKNDDMSGAEPKQLDITIEHGKLYNKPLDWWSIPAPDFAVLPALQALEVTHSQQVGQINFAVNNKKGSRTTAAEVRSADEENQSLKTPNLITLSSHVRAVYKFAWQIVQSQALQDKIVFMKDDLTGLNSYDEIAQNFEIRAAGDVDVVERNEKLGKMFTFWPIVLQIAPQFPQLVLKFLMNMLAIAFPEDFEAYRQIIEQQQMNDKAIIASLTQVLQSALSPEEMSALPPQTQMQLQSILASAATTTQQTPVSS